MGYASKLAQSFSNPDSTWGSLGALGSTSAWDQSSPVAERALYRLRNNPNRQPRNQAEDAEDLRRLVANIKNYRGDFAPNLNSFRARPQPGDYNLDSIMSFTGDSFLNAATNASDIFTNQVLAGRYMRNFNMGDLF